MPTHQYDRVHLSRLRIKVCNCSRKCPTDQPQKAHLSQAFDHDEQSSKKYQCVPFNSMKCLFNVVVIIEQKYKYRARNCDPHSCVYVGKRGFRHCDFPTRTGSESTSKSRLCVDEGTHDQCV